jgi:hypothetical protein
MMQHQYEHAIIAPRQFDLHLNPEGTLENENLHDRFLRTVRRSNRVAALFYHRNPVNQPIRRQIEQTLSDILEGQV